MPAHRKAAIRELAADAHELSAGVLQGRLRRDPDTGTWMVGETRLDELLARHQGEEIVLIVASLDDERPMPPRICRTCGMEYRGSHCPRCREARIRLRGR